LGSIFMGVRRAYNGDNSEDLYVSDFFHGDFILSLANVSSNDAIDFVQILGIPGVYIANQVLSSGELVSYITFNIGSTWNRLLAGQCDTCYVNLILTTDGGLIDFSGSSLGTLLALGNEGDTLNTTAGSSSIYYSNNGGLGWTSIKPGNWLFTSANFGSMIVASSPYYSNDALSYTTNQGQAWVDCNFIDNSTHFNETFTVASFFEHEREDIPFVLISAYSLDSNGTNRYYLYSIEFPVPRACVDGDFESWSTHAVNGDCILGQQTLYKRLKAGVDCLLSEGDDERETVGICNCTRDDYTCNFCYTLDISSGDCVLDPSCTQYEANVPPVNCSGNFTSSSRFRRVYGDVCVNDLTNLLEPTSLSCPNSDVTPTASLSDLQTEPGIVITLIFLSCLLFVLFIILIVVYFIRFKKMKESKVFDE